MTQDSRLQTPGSFLRGCERGFKDSRICSAATEVSFAGFTHLCERRIGILLQVSGDGRDEAGRAEAAHQGVLLDESRLHCVERFRRAPSLDCCNLLPDSINGQYET